jgi:hypothetical protein
MKIVVIMNDTALTLAQSNGLIYYSTTHTSQRLLSLNLLATSVVTFSSVFFSFIYTDLILITHSICECSDSQMLQHLLYMPSIEFYNIYYTCRSIEFDDNAHFVTIRNAESTWVIRGFFD